MAAILKCTKLSVSPSNAFPPGQVAVKVDYIDPTTSPPTPGVTTVVMPHADAEDPTTMQTNIDTAMAPGGLTVDWAL